jgi:serine/threonine-protein kinase
VEGSVQVDGNRLRVSVQLIDPVTETHLWAEHYDGTLDDAFAVQSDIAQRIVEAVGGTLSAAEAGAIGAMPTANAEAYRLYLQGEEYHRRPGRQRQNLESAQQLYERAVALDSTFALAHAALSITHGEFSWYRYDPSLERLTRQQDEAQTALRLAPNLAQAHHAMGSWHYFGRRDWQPALREYRIALEGLPNDAELWERVGAVHRRLGNWDGVDTALAKATNLDPRDASLWEDFGGGTLLITRRYAEAVRAYNRALGLAPDLRVAAGRKAEVYVLWKGELDTLRAFVKGIPRDVELGPLGRPSWLSVHTLRLDPRWDPIRNDPRFQAFLVKYDPPQPVR